MDVYVTVSDKEHIRHRILFAFQPEKSAAGAAAMICRTLGEAVTRATCKNWYKRRIL